MRVVEASSAEWPRLERGTAVTVGVFDGVHKGHQATLARLHDLAAGRPTVVASFVPHPVAVLAPGNEPGLLTTKAQRVRLLEALGVDVVVFVAFDPALSKMTAPDFVEDVLVESLGAELIVVGADFRFGFNREGNVALLRRLAKPLGYRVAAVTLAGGTRPLSSTAVRRALASGNVAEAAEILGRPFALEGVVVRGAGRGAAIGVPTANLGLEATQFIPGRGVYAVIVRLDDARLPGVCNVGVRPTFGGTEDVVEVHLLDFAGDLRGRTVEVEFMRRLRDERRFDGVDALVAQIRIDIADADRYFAGGERGA